MHRIGRTGRAGTKGKAITFWDERKDSKTAKALADIVRSVQQEVPDFLDEAASKGGGKGKARSRWGGGGGKGRGGGGKGGGGKGKGGGGKGKGKGRKW